MCIRDRLKSRRSRQPPPVDYAIRVPLLERIQRDLCRDRRETMCRLLLNWRDGGIKLAILATLLTFRREHEELFAQGTYEPLFAHGGGADRVCAFLRRNGQAILSAVSRFPGRSDGPWGHTVLTLPEDLRGKAWRDVLTGMVWASDREQLHAENLFADLPVSVLVPALT